LGEAEEVEIDAERPTDVEAAAEPELELDETEGLEETEPETLRFEIASYPADYTVEVLVAKWRAGELVIPTFQRAYVWNQPKASKLIESFLIGLPVPQVFLYKDRETGKLLVVDGHQRLSTIARFYDEQFSETRIFRLQGVHARWQGKRYSDLEEQDRRRLDNSPLRSIIVQQLTPNDQESIYLIFERLNAGGVNLNPMEIRKSVFHGPAIEAVERLNLLPAWRLLIGQANPDQRLRDLELVVRVLALANGWGEYTKPMKAFLTRYLEDLAKKSETDREAVEADFAEAVDLAHAALGDRPFHLRGRLNVAALDVFLASTIVSGVRDPQTLAACFTGLVNDRAFQQNVYFNTSDAQVIRNRFGSVLGCLGSETE
jgi:Protein of unknown function DUF262